MSDGHKATRYRGHIPTLTYGQAIALAGWMREHDAQHAQLTQLNEAAISVCMFSDHQADSVASGVLTRSGNIREDLRAA